MALDASAPSDDPYKVGERVAVNGCCLTVISAEPITFEVSEEALRRTMLAGLKAGAIVNLERAMRAVGRFGGHIVQGHVDAVGQLLSVRPTEKAHIKRFCVPDGSERYLIDKGPITVNGISLTVVEPHGCEFEVWIIPHTWENTDLKGLLPGDPLNLEFDVLAKYVEKLLGPRS